MSPPARSPDDVGALPWVLHRASALALVGLLALHLGVQLYPEYGFAAVARWAGYGALLDLTLGVVLLHAFLGVRATIVETHSTPRGRAGATWLVGIVALALFAFRLFG